LAVDEIASELTEVQSLNVHRVLVFVERRGTGLPEPAELPDLLR